MQGDELSSWIYSNSSSTQGCQATNTNESREIIEDSTSGLLDLGFAIEESSVNLDKTEDSNKKDSLGTNDNWIDQVSNLRIYTT